MNRYEEMLSTPTREIANSASIYIPPGPRLGDVVSYMNDDTIVIEHGDDTDDKERNYVIILFCI